MLLIAEQLIGMSQNNQLEDLKECIADVRAGRYTPSIAAKIAAGTYQPEVDAEGN